MEGEKKEDSMSFEVVADKVFETLLTITTILSGVYVSVTFSWFGQAMIEPHPGEPMKPEMVTQAITGIILGLIFILLLVLILLSWAFSRFKGSNTWRTVSWSGLIYCLAQDFIGILALLGFPLIAVGAADPLAMAMVTGAIPVVIILPPLMGTVFGYRISVGYGRRQSTAEIRNSKHALTALMTNLFILCIQALLGVTIWIG